MVVCPSSHVARERRPSKVLVAPADEDGGVDDHLPNSSSGLFAAVSSLVSSAFTRLLRPLVAALLGRVFLLVRSLSRPLRRLCHFLFFLAFRAKSAIESSGKNRSLGKKKI